MKIPTIYGYFLFGILLTCPLSVEARLGWTLDQCKKEYGTLKQTEGNMNSFVTGGGRTVNILVDSKEEGGVIVNTIKSGLFVFLIKICQWGNFRNEASLFSYFRYPDRECIDVLKYYNISEEEEDFMKDNLV